MIPASTRMQCYSLLLLAVQIARLSAAPAPGFSSHISINTPARSFSHGVGRPIGAPPIKTYRPINKGFRRPMSHNFYAGGGGGGGGYPKVQPSIPFTGEDIGHNTIPTAPWNHNDFIESQIPVLPPSPYKVDSPDPESLWPEGLFLPPFPPTQFGPKFGRRSDNGEVLSEEDPLDPYLLEGSEAIAAVEKAKDHGELYFHDIPHIDSLLAYQELRAENNLERHRLGSIRHTWQFFRP